MKLAVLYSNDCPKCKILEKQLDDAKIPFIKSNHFEDVIARGFRSAPILLLEDDTMMVFNEALKYIMKKRG